jgi:hypothetical protein
VGRAVTEITLVVKESPLLVHVIIARKSVLAERLLTLYVGLVEGEGRFVKLLAHGGDDCH